MTFEQLKEIYELPFFDLIHKAHEVHVSNWPEKEIQLCTLLCIKTGGCSGIVRIAHSRLVTTQRLSVSR